MAGQDDGDGEQEPWSENQTVSGRAAAPGGALAEPGEVGAAGPAAENLATEGLKLADVVALAPFG